MFGGSMNTTPATLFLPGSELVEQVGCALAPVVLQRTPISARGAGFACVRAVRAGFRGAGPRMSALHLRGIPAQNARGRTELRFTITRVS
jgi:hypothetical protein